MKKQCFGSTKWYPTFWCQARGTKKHQKPLEKQGFGPPDVVPSSYAKAARGSRSACKPRGAFLKTKRLVTSTTLRWYQIGQRKHRPNMT